MREFFKQFFKDKISLIALSILVILYIAIFLANFIALYPKDFSNRKMSYAPPSNVYFITPEGKFSRPYTYNYIRKFDKNSLKTYFIQDRSQKYYINFFTKGFEYKFLGIFKTKRHLLGVQNGGELFLLGCDINGRDNFSRLLYGGQVSLTIGFLALFISFPIGLIYGGIAGYFGRKTDTIMMRFAEAPLYIDDTSGCTIEDIISKCRSLATKENRLSLIIIDYLQLIEGNTAEILSGLKKLAKEINVPILCLSQLSRELEHREDKRPILSDLRGQIIVKNADIIMFLYRDDYYTPSEDTAYSVAEIIIAKNRDNYDISTVKLNFKGNITKFEDIEN